MDYALRVVSKKSLPNAKLPRFYAIFVPRRFIVFGVTFRSRNHFGVKCGSTLIFLLMDVQLF